MALKAVRKRVLNYFKKGLKIEHVERLVYAFSKVKRITPAYSFIIGVPAEAPEEYKSTLKLIKFIAKYNPNAKIIGPQYFRIYPGGELYEEVVKKYHYAEPASFEEWALRHSPDNDPYGFNKNISYPWIKHWIRILCPACRYFGSFFYAGYQAVSKNKVNLASALYSIGKDEDESWLVWRTF